MRATQLRLVTEPPPSHDADVDTDPTRAVFEHWVFMLGRQAARCKLGPTRRAAINGALTLYTAGDLMLAIEGLASEAFEGATQHMADAMREIEWLLKTEARVERFIRQGEQLREAAARMEERARQRAAMPQPMVDETDQAAQAEAAQQARTRLQVLAARMREGAR